ncbi:hypothetical protein K438DRAFT_656757 [Mycena galopus ATCC 62051]|nr:hypothetical protein K438DRAFT_926268 [Mycena galopus ATCC 62051]KAF8143079.1 hypothetical protein K438DRAFT_656757 [Mycena galopus ATCC 62051]
MPQQWMRGRQKVSVCLSNHANDEISVRRRCSSQNLNQSRIPNDYDNGDQEKRTTSIRLNLCEP